MPLFDFEIIPEIIGGYFQARRPPTPYVSALSHVILIKLT
jgi:hypothetical protein